MLTGKLVKLRGVEPEDIDFLFKTENDVSLWKVSETSVPFTREVLKQYAESVHDIYSQGQYRFIIESLEENTPVGMIDLYDFNSLHGRAGVGIVINSNYMGKGLALDALAVLIRYATEVLFLSQLFCSIHGTNVPSVNLFLKSGFKQVGVRRNWFKTRNGWDDELLFQCLLS
ncbi:MAG: GNAT family N-acetyltransferase [Flavobacteriales bacterium]|nr:GNAT family N-acetyltransferase [Flavobacteriales bacterium]MCB9196223.1 GNAT family N-acetyltransferase [Flavobacteriales bacterium]